MKTHNEELYISVEFREWVSSTYNVERGDHWAFLDRVLLHPFYDEGHRDKEALAAGAQEVIVVDYFTIKEIATNFKGVDHFISGFEVTTGMKMNLSGYSRVDGKARTISPCWPPELKEKLLAELSVPLKDRDKSKMVIFSTGESYSDYKAKKLRSDYVRRVCEEADVNVFHPLFDAVAYLHSEKVAKKLASLVDSTNRDRSAELTTLLAEYPKSVYARKVWERVSSYPLVEYRESGNTRRVSPIGYSIMSLPRGIRNFLFAGYYYLDIRACQLSICASLWDCKLLGEFLTTGVSFWKMLFDYMCIPYSPVVKGGLKDCIYALCYGMGQKKLKALVVETVGLKAGELLLSCPIIVELLKQRRLKSKEIASAGGAYDFYGKWMHYKREGKSSNMPSILAQIAQSYEVAIMKVVFQEVSDYPNLDLVLWLHDGIVCQPVNYKEDIPSWITNNLSKEVSKYSKLIGVTVDLEFEILPAFSVSSSLCPTGSLVLPSRGI